MCDLTEVSIRNRKMDVPFLLAAVALLAPVLQATNGQPCEEGTKYKRGECAKCKPCYAGSEFNYTNVDIDIKMGYLSCPPCSPCPEGRYREPNSLGVKCSKCRKNCTKENKMWKTLCGGTSPGVCGNCMEGYVQGSIDSNSPCIKQPEVVVCAEGQYLDQGTCRDCEDCGVQNRSTEVPCRGQNKGKCGPCLDGYVHSEASNQCVKKLHEYADVEGIREWDENTYHDDDKTVWIVFGSVFFGLIVVFSVVAFVLNGCGTRSRHGFNRSRSAIPNRSAAAEAGMSTDSEEAFIQKTKVVGEENDVEPDGPGGAPVRRELEDERSSFLSPPALSVPSPKFYPDMVITLEEGLGKEILKYIAKKIFGEQVQEFFRYLKVGEEDVYPEHDRYLKREQQYVDYKFNVLILWIRENGKRATLDVLCDALDRADFHKVLRHVLKMYDDDSSRGQEAGESSGEVGAGIGPSTAHNTQDSEAMPWTTD